MTLLGWWVIACSGVSLCAASVTGMINFWVPSFEAAPWQTYLAYLGTIIVTGESMSSHFQQHQAINSQDSFSRVHRSSVCPEDHPSNAVPLSVGVPGRVLYASRTQEEDAACFIHHTTGAWNKWVECRYSVDDGDWERSVGTSPLLRDVAALIWLEDMLMGVLTLRSISQKKSCIQEKTYLWPCESDTVDLFSNR